jgi:hypothetical protein
MTREQFEEIFDNNNSHLENYYDNAFEGLQLIHEYLPETTLITGASHDEIYSVYISELLRAGITEEDVLKLRDMNWAIEEYWLSCFV